MSVSNKIVLDNLSLLGTLMPFQPCIKERRHFSREDIMKVRDNINKIINSQGWFFSNSSSET